MRFRDGELFWAVIGSCIIAAGASLAGLYAFENRPVIVMGGFLVFIAGYRVSQVGIHSTGDRSEVLQRLRTVEIDRELLARAGLVVVGWIGISLGVTLFSQTILHPSVQNAAISGVSSIGGYMCAHVGINGVGLGDSFFRSVLDFLQGAPEEGS